jgi:hypothetical protein
MLKSHANRIFSNVNFAKTASTTGAQEVVSGKFTKECRGGNADV